MRPRPSLRARLTLLFALGASVVLLALGWGLGQEVQRHFEQLDRYTLEDKLRQVHKLVQSTPPAALRSALENALLDRSDLAALVQDEHGTVWLRSPGAALDALALQAAPSLAQAPLLQWRDAQGTTQRSLALRLPRPAPEQAQAQAAQGDALTVVVALDTRHHEHFMQALTRVLWIFVAASAAVMGLLGWFVATQGLAPLRSMGEQAQDITAQRLDRRLSVDEVPPELEQLAATLNAMLERLHEAFARLSDFSADLAHELRTPLSNLMTNTQVALAHSRDAQTYRTTLESNAEELERLARMVDDMLFLAKAQAGHIQSWVRKQAQTVDVRAQLDALVEFYDALAQERQVRLQLRGQGQVAGEPLMLRRALGNLLGNALAYAPPQSRVDMEIRAEEGRCTITLRNPGVLSAAQLQRLFERFYRCPHGAEPGSGSGLGLAIARAIVQAHGGNIQAESTNGEVVFTVEVPVNML